jgi:hypothetical protein
MIGASNTIQFQLDFLYFFLLFKLPEHSVAKDGKNIEEDPSTNDQTNYQHPPFPVHFNEAQSGDLEIKIILTFSEVKHI